MTHPLSQPSRRRRGEEGVLQERPSNDSFVLSYLALRKSIGIIGVALPVVLALGKIALGDPGIESSISGYYYTNMRDVFVGSMCAIAVFLMSYRGYERSDEIAGDLACVFALGVALFPTTPEISPSALDRIVGGVHLLSAACFLLTLAYFSLVLFRKTHPHTAPTERKVLRNKVYRVCGYVIVVCIALIALLIGSGWSQVLSRFDPVFWLESAAVVAFGISWLTKGETFLRDRV